MLKFLPILIEKKVIPTLLYMYFCLKELPLTAHVSWTKCKRAPMKIRPKGRSWVLNPTTTTTTTKTRWRHAKGFAATTIDPIEHISEEKSLLKIFVKICSNCVF